MTPTELSALIQKLRNYTGPWTVPAEAATALESLSARVQELERELAKLKANISAHDYAMALQNGLGIDMHAVMLESGRNLAKQALDAQAERNAALKRVGELEKQLEVVTQSWEAAEVRWDEERDRLLTRIASLEQAIREACDSFRWLGCEADAEDLEKAALAAREVPK